MINKIQLLLFLALSLLSCSALADSPAASEAWYNLWYDEEYVTDFRLLPNESKELAVASFEPITVGFKTDVTHAMYQELAQKYGSKVIELTAPNSDASLFTISGGASSFQPENGKITIKISNLIDREFKVLIYKEKKGTCTTPFC